MGRGGRRWVRTRDAFLVSPGSFDIFYELFYEFIQFYTMFLLKEQRSLNFDDYFLKIEEFTLWPFFKWGSENNGYMMYIFTKQ